MAVIIFFQSKMKEHQPLGVFYKAIYVGNPTISQPNPYDIVQSWANVLSSDV